MSPLRDYFEENCTAYIVMEYLEGDDLSHYAKAHGKFELDEALDLLEPAMLVLDKVHKKGLIHRDISPSNIMVMSDGRVKVLDFGSARLQNASGELSLSIMLKPGYAPAGAVQHARGAGLMDGCLRHECDGLPPDNRQDPAALD